jgi:hypothetical protein
MGKKESLALKSGNEVYKSYRNNTDQKWIRDPGLRKLNMGLAFMFSSAAANGMHKLFPSYIISHLGVAMRPTLVSSFLTHPISFTTTNLNPS